jgi:beta-ureidopropionase
MENHNVSRRRFIAKSSLGLGAGLVGVSCTPGQSGGEIKKLPGEIRVASVDLRGLWPEKTRESRIKRMLERMDEVVGIKPDIICLPELFDSSWVEEQPPIAEIAEEEQTPGPITSRLATFAKSNNCYVVVPLITKKDNVFFQHEHNTRSQRGNRGGISQNASYQNRN